MQRIYCTRDLLYMLYPLNHFSWDYTYKLAIKKNSFHDISRMIEKSVYSSWIDKPASWQVNGVRLWRVGRTIAEPFWTSKYTLLSCGIIHLELQYLLHLWRAKKVDIPAAPRSVGPYSWVVDIITGSVMIKPSLYTPPWRSQNSKRRLVEWYE